MAVELENLNQPGKGWIVRAGRGNRLHAKIPRTWQRVHLLEREWPANLPVVAPRHGVQYGQATPWAMVLRASGQRPRSLLVIGTPVAQQEQGKATSMTGERAQNCSHRGFRRTHCTDSCKSFTKLCTTASASLHIKGGGAIRHAQA